MKEILFDYLNIYFRKDRRFLVIDQMQFILIEPDIKKVGWGIVKFCDLIQVNISFVFIKTFEGNKHK
jgi:hypothetical protein